MSTALSAGGRGLTAPPPLSVYVHLPWCLRKCPYCDFNSHELRNPEGALTPALEQAYLDALQADLEASLPLVWGRLVHSVFIGGGTPSLFSAQSIERLLEMLRARLRLAADAEVTLEANPGTFEAQRFADYRSAGVNRLSIGIQTFADPHLKAIGRVHDSRQARAAAELAAKLYPTFNLDLMYGLPGQTPDDVERDLAAAFDFDPPHLSYYNLTLEPNTYFAAHPPVLPDEDLQADMQAAIEERCAGRGLRHYEISAYARDGHRCRHNLNYWQFGDYLGIGAGAHGKLSSHEQIIRQSRFKHPSRYMQAVEQQGAVEEQRVLGEADLDFEFMLNALRLIEGVPSGLYEERTGQSITRLSRRLMQAEAQQLLVADPRVIQATPVGLRFLNDLQAIFLP